MRLGFRRTSTSTSSRLVRPVAAATTLALGASLAVVLGATAPAQARPAFYNPPRTITGAPGRIIRHQASTFYLDPAHATKADAKAQRIMYVSTTRTGRKIAVTGTVLTPNQPWSGPGVRPVVAYGVGTQGLGDQCAPSRQLSAGSEYEGGFINGLLQRGYAVAVTDYQGLGTPGVHTYVSRSVTGRAMLDSVRAAQRLRAAHLPDHGPVALTGYSQGGGASAAAAELARSYAPGLHLKGVVAGAIPGDLAAVGKNIDGTEYFAFLGYSVAGLSASYGINANKYLNAKGRAVLADLKQQCTSDSLVKYPFVQSKDLTRDGRPLTAYLAEQPYKRIVAEQKIGNHRRPSVPTLVTQSVADDVIPFTVGRDVARRWCALGANVRFDPNTGPTHVGGAVASYPDTFAFLESRFRGLPAVSNCGTF